MTERRAMPVGAGARQITRGFRVTMMNHPSLHVPDLSEVEAWFKRVFARDSIPFARILGGQPVRSDWPLDYCVFTPIGDVLVDSIDPRRYVVDGVQQYPTVAEPHLKDFGYYVAGLVDAYREIRARGFRVMNTLFEVQEGDEPSGPNWPAPFYTLREEAGLRYHFHSATHMLPGDPRSAPRWALAPVSDEDPLGIERCSHHTVLTTNPERACRLWVDALGGEVVHEGRDEMRATTSTCVHVGGSTLEYAVPDPGSPAHAEWAKTAPNDRYYAMTWRVADLERAERHLRAQGVGTEVRGKHAIVTEPATSLGVPWGFTDRLLEGDPRGRQ